MGVFCTRSCPFSSPSSSFTSKSLQNWTRNASRNASENAWKRSNRRSRKTPVRPREPRVAAVSDFSGTAGRRTHRKPKNRRCAAVRENRKFDRSPAQRVRSKEEMQRNGRDLPLAAGRGIWSLHRRSGDITDACVRELRGFGVDTSRIVTGDGRFGVYYVEGGANQLPSRVIYDRAWSAIAMAKPGDIDWDKAFEGVEWFHITGITPAISESAMALSLESVQEAKKRGITVSCDLNYRKNLWKYARIRTTTGEAGGCCVFTILSIRRFLPLPRSTGSGMCVSPGRSA